MCLLWVNTAASSKRSAKSKNKGNPKKGLFQKRRRPARKGVSYYMIGSFSLRCLTSQGNVFLQPQENAFFTVPEPY